MNAPIMPARTAIQEVRLALSDGAAASGTGREPNVMAGVVVDMACLLRDPFGSQPLRSGMEAMRVASALVSIVG